jgi:DNA-binding transcriptional LysR family regulator
LRYTSEELHNGPMDVARLRTLRVLAMRQTMAAVAEALRVSPSAVSQQIAQLETEAGLRLIERRGRRVRLTQAGQRLVKHAERIIAALEDAKADLAVLKQTVTGELRVAAFSSVAAALIPQVMKALERRHARLSVVLEEMEPADSLAALRAWQTDVALIDDLTVPAGAPEPNIERLSLLEDQLYVVLPKRHRLATRARVAISDLREERWAMDTAFNTYSDVIIKACQAAGFDPVVNGKCTGFEVVQPLIEQGCSIAILPGLRVRHRRGAFCVKRLTPEIHRKIFVAFRRGERRHPAIAAFVEQLQQSAKALRAAVSA